MNLDDAFERCLESLYEAALDDARWPAASALIDEACGVGGNALTVGESSGGEDRIHFARLLYRGESRQDLARVCRAALPQQIAHERRDCRRSGSRRTTCRTRVRGPEGDARRRARRAFCARDFDKHACRRSVRLQDRRCDRPLLGICWTFGVQHSAQAQVQGGSLVGTATRPEIQSRPLATTHAEGCGLFCFRVGGWSRSGSQHRVPRRQVDHDWTRWRVIYAPSLGSVWTLWR